MPVVAVYETEQELITYLHGYLGADITASFNLVDNPPSPTYQQAVNQALRMLAIQTVDQVAGSRMELAAHIAIWRLLRHSYTLRFNFSADGGSYNVGDVWGHINAMLAQAESEGIAAGVINSGQGSTVLKTKIGW